METRIFDVHPTSERTVKRVFVVREGKSFPMGNRVLPSGTRVHADPRWVKIQAPHLLQEEGVEDPKPAAEKKAPRAMKAKNEAGGRTRAIETRED